ncbi:MAG: UpxY family transcription antiterminator [Bacteroidales bacterium]|nr:UpxY family transcription antiterminator [Bacteroidales bacterium]MBQ8644889.1 UpxY family transcription antiterminator [Bacteroidales bacterium]
MQDSTAQWFAMRATYKREMIAKDYLLSKGLEVYVPMKTVIKVVRGIKRKLPVPAINSLIFVHAQKDVLQQVKWGVEYLQYMTRKEDGKNVPIVVPQKQMDQFMQIVQDDTISKTFFTPEEVDLSAGTKVRVHGGPFDGYEGVLAKVKGKRKKQFFLDIPNVVAVSTVIENLHLLEVVE